MKTKNTLFFLLSILFLTSCTPKYTVVQETKSGGPIKRTTPETLYYADINGDGNYEPIKPEIEPEPVQGKTQWMMDFYRSIKYPAMARENGIQGLVILNSMIDKSGKVTSVEIKKGLSSECDEEAKRAYIASAQNGYSPLLIDGVSVNFRIELPVGFWLE